MNNSLTDIISNNFITGFRAIDCCRIKNKVVKIRSINNEKYDILPEKFENIFYNETIINGKVIPYIYGDINSYLKLDSSNSKIYFYNKSFLKTFVHFLTS
jgi:hypothetical protein